jgi:hypothetical protein
VKEYDLVEQLKNPPAKISLCDLIQNLPTYHCMLKTTLQQMMVTPDAIRNDVVALIQGMNVVNVDIIFYKHELPPLVM